MDSDLKKEMEETCRELGMNMTTAFTVFAKKVAREKRIPFEVSIANSFEKIDYDKSKVIAVDPALGYALLPKQWDHKGDSVYDQLA
jgi:DNA-damage-inducible protein J